MKVGKGARGENCGGGEEKRNVRELQERGKFGGGENRKLGKVRAWGESAEMDRREICWEREKQGKRVGGGEKSKKAWRGEKEVRVWRRSEEQRKLGKERKR